MSNADSSFAFAAAVDQATAANADFMRRVIQRAALMIIGSVVAGDPGYSPGTPVDTGFARSSWYTTLAGEGSTAPTMGDDASPAKGLQSAVAAGDPVAAAISAVSEFQLGETIWLVNNVPYIVRLEYGWSKQAPTGMVRLTLSASQEIMDAAVLAESAA